MIDGIEISSRILASLEEAGHERANPLLNTIIDPMGETEEVVAFQQALAYLLAQRLIGMRLTSIPHGDQPLGDSEAKLQIEELASHYKFNAAESLWSDSRFSGPPYYQLPEPEIVLTKLGRAKSVELLNERGYEWWRSKV